MAEVEKYVFVRAIYGKGPDAIKRYGYIPDGGMNALIKSWQSKQPERKKDHATPSQIATCPRVIWYLNHDIPVTNEMTWAVKHRLLLGRLFENQFATILKDEGKLLFHWADDEGLEVKRFSDGEGLDRDDGVPDYLLKLVWDNQEIVAVSDAKTSRSDSFGYIGFTEKEIFSDWGWYKYRLQLTDYYMLCHSEDGQKWFKENKLPLPTHCHLFSYALDDGVVRREITWIPTEEDMATVKRLRRRFNEAVESETVPDCTCGESFDGFETKFCRFANVPEGSKVGTSCCDISLAKDVR